MVRSSRHLAGFSDKRLGLGLQVPAAAPFDLAGPLDQPSLQLARSSPTARGASCTAAFSSACLAVYRLALQFPFAISLSECAAEPATSLDHSVQP